MSKLHIDIMDMVNKLNDACETTDNPYPFKFLWSEGSSRYHTSNAESYRWETMHWSLFWEEILILANQILE